MAEQMTTPAKDEIDAKLDASEARVDARLANFDVSVKTGFAELRTAFAELCADMARQIGELRAEMEKMRADMHKDMKKTVKWVIGFGLANIGAIFAVSRMAEKPTSQADVRPPPIIITIPQPAAPPAAPAPAPAK
ncbi:hypothetical protein RBA41_29600 [Massilia sp. CCM 9210]|uniref:hypothetical protein n=1 Tax=Massilia scottii TaxID=3057166 RepID=UPI0027967D3C|nr:hypothetical protein [Massilia sp. CCM 9210]MDQ1817468.1 hypothetical protein [Massilia sp. CCM 9210]